MFFSQTLQLRFHWQEFLFLWLQTFSLLLQHCKGQLFQFTVPNLRPSTHFFSLRHSCCFCRTAFLSVSGVVSIGTGSSSLAPTFPSVLPANLPGMGFALVSSFAIFASISFCFMSRSAAIRCCTATVPNLSSLEDDSCRTTCCSYEAVVSVVVELHLGGLGKLCAGILAQALARCPAQVLQPIRKGFREIPNWTTSCHHTQSRHGRVHCPCQRSRPSCHVFMFLPTMNWSASLSWTQEAGRT